VLAAVESSDVIFVCVVNYEASDEMLQTPDVTAALSGKTLVQFSSGTPERAAKRTVGAPARRVVFGLHDVRWSSANRQQSRHVLLHGRQEVFDAWRDVITPLIGTSTYCGEELGYAAALDFARLGALTGVLTVLGNVVSLLQAEGCRWMSLFQPWGSSAVVFSRARYGDDR